MNARAGRISVALFAYFALASSATAATRQVATTGTDWANDCLSSPCASIGQALVVAAQGDSIAIAPGVYVLGGTLVIEKSLTLLGSGPLNTHVTVAEGISTSVVVVEGENTKVHIENLEIRGAHDVAEGGGGVRNGGKLVLRNVHVRNNRTSSTGGGVYNLGDMWIYESLIEGNESEGMGGGIHNFGSMVVYASYILGNVVTRPDWSGGGGIMNVGQLLVARSTIAENRSAAIGGGITNSSQGNLLLLNTTVTGNHAETNGGGVHSAGKSRLTHVTVAHNTIGISDSLPFSAGGVVAAVNGDVELRNSIVAWNSKNECGATHVGFEKPLIYGQGNVTRDFTCGLSDSLNTLGVDPLLGPLDYHGGTTPSYFLLPGSPAIDAASEFYCMNEDQRGFARPIDGDGSLGAQCDAGAFEVQDDDDVNALSKKGRHQIWRRQGPGTREPQSPRRRDGSIVAPQRPRSASSTPK